MCVEIFQNAMMGEMAGIAEAALGKGLLKPLMLSIAEGNTNFMGRRI